ncbi:hypothetical protein DPMN_079511 [Dreissena polymorpha]|uniref:Uncharacterized protein n=1 Tax=Dreissena polymorpha TaxID=45954 RepID=A0A9D3YSQ0_DREPO|nr:hypothetical protein DPMN_079511 [Dreissena polymorpha]
MTQARPSDGRILEPAQEIGGPEVPAGPEDVDENMMKQILGSMYKDRDYLEKLLGETGLRRRIVTNIIMLSHKLL